MYNVSSATFDEVHSSDYCKFLRQIVKMHVVLLITLADYSFLSAKFSPCRHIRVHYRIDL